MPRTRKKIESSPDQGEFDPMAVGTAANNPTFEEDQRPAYPEDEDGNLPQDSVDDGPQGGVVELQFNADDPSDINALGRTTAGMSQGQQAAAAELKRFMERKTRLLEEKQAIMEDIKELNTEMKGLGYDVKAVDLVLKIDNLSDTQKEARRAQNLVNATYAVAVGIDEELL